VAVLGIKTWQLRFCSLPPAHDAVVVVVYVAESPVRPLMLTTALLALSQTAMLPTPTLRS
jgi:hypothetical protein